jgi:hypothetical protein
LRGGKEARVEELIVSIQGAWTIGVVLRNFLPSVRVEPFHLGLKIGNIVVVTGKEDVISDGEHTIIIKNGNALLGKITGV